MAAKTTVLYSCATTVKLTDCLHLSARLFLILHLYNCQDLGPDKLYSTLRWMTFRSSICGKLSTH